MSTKPDPNIFDKLAQAFGTRPSQQPNTKVTIAEIIARKVSYVVYEGKLYKVTAEEAEITK